MFSILGSICVGDKTSCGGTVIAGSPFACVNGRPIARVGDKIACTKNCVIVAGDSNVIMDGAAMALHGAQTSGNCTCFSGNNDFHGEGHTPASISRVAVAADAGLAFMPVTAKLLNEDHWLEFRLVDGNERPIPHQPYLAIDPSGAKYSGRLDAEGFARVSSVKAGKCKISFPDLDYSMDVETCQP